MAADTLTPTASTSRATTHVMSCGSSVIVTTDDPAAGEHPAVGDGPAMAQCAIARLHQLEQRWSRFLPNSEISGLNRAGGEPRIASADTARLVTELVRAWHATSGSFDPTLLGTLVELGYAASRDDITLRTSLTGDAAPQGNPVDIMVDEGTGWIRLPPGTTLDPGGLGKGLAADIVVEELIAAGAAGALVEVGGDLRVAGRPPAGEAWTIAIAPTSDDDDTRLVQLSDGGVATSTSRFRSWRQDGERRHHLIDPRTLRSSETDTVSCSVVAGSAAWAEAFTKVAFAEPLDTALDRFESLGLAASITTNGLHRHVSSAWEGFTR